MVSNPRPIARVDAAAAIRRVLEGDEKAIAYRPEFVDLTGSVVSAILLQQIIYRSAKKTYGGYRGRPFFKFSAPCAHPEYRRGDSWQEELHFSRREFESALRRIGKKVTKGESKRDACETALVVYWTDSSRKTWYQPNWPVLGEKLVLLYSCQDEESEKSV